MRIDTRPGSRTVAPEGVTVARTLGGSEKNRVVEAPGARAAARCRRRGSTGRVRDYKQSIYSPHGN